MENAFEEEVYDRGLSARGIQRHHRRFGAWQFTERKNRMIGVFSASPYVVM